MRLLYLIVFISFFQVDVFYGQSENLNGLKAILIVGHQEDGTRSAIQKMDKIANLFSENGIIVYKFYDDKADWNNIIKIAKKCNFFVYSGHGSTMGVNGNTGGICINSMVSSYELIKSLRLKENALVIFKSVCRGAGSSAGDNTDIGIIEAKKRVANYAYPFFEIGASAYYANNYGRGAYNFLEDFLRGVNLKQAYINTTKTWTDVEFEEVFSRDKNKFFSIASCPGGGVSTRTTHTNGLKKVEKVKSHKGYDIAYVGQRDFTIYDMGIINANIPKKFSSKNKNVSVNKNTQVFDDEEKPSAAVVSSPKSDPKGAIKIPVVEEKNDYNLLAPNAFTPNSSDSRINRFIPYALTQREISFQMIILDIKNGGMVYQTSDSLSPWDGIDTRTGQMVNKNSVFIWKVILTNPAAGEPKEYIGTITVL